MTTLVILLPDIRLLSNISVVLMRRLSIKINLINKLKENYWKYWNAHPLKICKRLNIRNKIGRTK